MTRLRDPSPSTTEAPRERGLLPDLTREGNHRHGTRRAPIKAALMWARMSTSTLRTGPVTSAPRSCSRLTLRPARSASGSRLSTWSRTTRVSRTTSASPESLRRLGSPGRTNTASGSGSRRTFSVSPNSKSSSTCRVGRTAGGGRLLGCSCQPTKIFRSRSALAEGEPAKVPLLIPMGNPYRDQRGTRTGSMGNLPRGPVQVFQVHLQGPASFATLKAARRQTPTGAGCEQRTATSTTVTGGLKRRRHEPR